VPNEDADRQFLFCGKMSPRSSESQGAAADTDKAQVLRSSQLTLVQEKIRARRAGVAGPKPMRSVPGSAACGTCFMSSQSNAKGRPEDIITCATCGVYAHPSCMHLEAELVETIRTYEWQCLECKICTMCRDAHDEDKMLFCDSCDRGYHTFCVGLAALPKGRWVCKLCGVCASCGTTTPGRPDDPKAKWCHEYAEGPRGKSAFLQTLCVSCSKLFQMGDFCPSCLVVYRTDDTDLPMVQCDTCDRWIHTECDNIDEDRYDELAEDGSHYSCLLCRGEQEERNDAFHRRNLRKQEQVHL